MALDPSKCAIRALIGNTPLLPLRRIAPDLPPTVSVWLKAEWYNPGGSVKDRAALSIVEGAIKRGELVPSKSLLDASSGNTGIAYAMLGAAMGFEVTLCLPANANMERKKILLAYGAKLVLTDPNDGSDGAILRAQEIFADSPDRYYYADQYSNPDNWRAHYRTTAPELWTQSNETLTHFVAGLGTSGTSMGVSKYFKDNQIAVHSISVQPDSPFHGLEGLKHMESAIVPNIYDPTIPNEDRCCETEAGFATTKKLATTEGILAGWSTGAALNVALEVARELANSGKSGCVVALGPDSGERYLSDHLWEST